MPASVTSRQKRVGTRLSGPLLWFLVFYVGGLAIVTVTFFLTTAAGIAGVLVFLAFLYLAYFWLALYMVVEFQLWRHMRNMGHLLQFLGCVLLLASVLSAYVPLLLGGLSLGIGLLWLVVDSVQGSASVTGFVMLFYGHYHKEYHASDVDMYRNVVVRAGESVSSLTDGYSTRVYETRYDAFPSTEVAAKAHEYAGRFQKAGFYLAHRADATGFTLYPVAYTGIGGFRLVLAFGHLLRLARRPEELTWIRVDWTGSVRVHVSREDYRRIRRPVAHHALCSGVADAVVGSLLAYAGGRETAAVAALLGPDRTHRPEELRLPTPVRDRNARRVIAVSIALLVATVGAWVVGWTVAQSPVWISNVHWSPQSPQPGQAIEISATILNLGGMNAFQGGPQIYYWAYFNDTSNGSVSLANVQGNEYRATIGGFRGNSEVTFLIAQEFQSTLTARLAQSAAYVLQIGTVPRGGPSGLTLSGMVVPTPSNPFVVPGVWINSTSPITDIRLLFAEEAGWAMDNGGGAFGSQPLEFPLTGSGSFYSYESGSPFGFFGIPSYATHYRGTVDMKFVAKDATGNTVSGPFIVIELNH